MLYEGSNINLLMTCFNPAIYSITANWQKADTKKLPIPNVTFYSMCLIYNTEIRYSQINRQYFPRGLNVMHGSMFDYFPERPWWPFFKMIPVKSVITGHVPHYPRGMSLCRTLAKPHMLSAYFSESYAMFCHSEIGVLSFCFCFNAGVDF